MLTHIYSKIFQPAPAWSCHSQEGPLASGPGQWSGLLCAIVLSSETSSAIETNAASLQVTLITTIHHNPLPSEFEQEHDQEVRRTS